MNLVLTFCVAALIGGTLGHGSTGSGNFMASTPCFSFQGQNILWPAGPQGFAGMCNPFSNIFSHPFFGGGMPGMPMPRPGEPIEATSPSSSHSGDDHAPLPGPAIAVKAAETPVETHATNADVPVAPIVSATPTEVHATPVEASAVQVEAPAVPIVSPAAHVEAPAVAPINVAAAPVDVSAAHIEAPAAPVLVPGGQISAPAAHIDTPVAPFTVPAPQVETHATHVEGSAASAIVPAAPVETHANIAPAPIVHTPIAQAPVVHAPHVDVSAAHVETPIAPVAVPAEIAPTTPDVSHASPVINNKPIGDHISTPSVVGDAPLHGHSVIAPVHHAGGPQIVQSATPAILRGGVHTAKHGISIPHEEASASSEGSEPEAPKTNGKSSCGLGSTLEGFGPLVESCDIGSLNFTDFGYPTTSNILSSCGSHGIHPLHVDGNWHIHSGPYDFGESPVHFSHGGLIDHNDIYGDHGIHHYPFDYGCHSEPSYVTNVLPPICALNVSNINDICNLTEIQSMLPPDAKIVKTPAELKCGSHHITNELKPVIDECITNIPFIRNHIKEKEESFTHHIPIVENHVGTCEEKRVCHVPILNHHTHNIMEEETDHVPITKSRLIPVVQTFLNHIPLTRQYTRPIVESSLSHVPVMETHIKPVIHHSIHTVPITEKRITPVTHETVVNVPQYIHGIPHDHYDHAALDQNTIDSHVDNHQVSYDSHHAYPIGGNNFQSESAYGGDNFDGGNVYGGQEIANFRKHLYLSSQVVSREHEDLYNQEQPSSSSQEAYANYGEGSLQESDCVGPCRAYDAEGSSQEYYNSDDQDDGAASAPLVHGIPFPGQSGEDFSKDSDYSGHPDYCD